MAGAVLEALACLVLRLFLIVALFTRPKGRSRTIDEAGPDPDWR